MEKIAVSADTAYTATGIAENVTMAETIIKENGKDATRKKNALTEILNVAKRELSSAAKKKDAEKTNHGLTKEVQDVLRFS